jgi:hypothetical protein
MPSISFSLKWRPAGEFEGGHGAAQLIRLGGREPAPTIATFIACS